MFFMFPGGPVHDQLPAAIPSAGSGSMSGCDVTSI